MYRVLNKNDYWYKNISRFDRWAFSLVIFLNYLSAFVILGITFYINHNIGRIKKALIDLSETTDTNYLTQIDLFEKSWGIVKVTFIFSAIFIIIWTIILKNTKSRIMSTIMLVFCSISLILSFFTVDESVFGIVYSAFLLFLYIPFTKATYQFQRKWYNYQTNMAYDEKIKSQKAAARTNKELVHNEGFQPFQNEETSSVNVECIPTEPINFDEF